MIEVLTSSDACSVHGLARQRVTDNPQDETAALELRDVIRRVPPQPKNPAHDELVGASLEVETAADLLRQGNAEGAEVTLRAHLAKTPNDPIAMRMMAQIAMECGFLDNAYKILVRSLEIDRTRADNWAELGKVLHRIASQSGDLQTVEEALATLDHAAIVSPGHLESLSYKAAVLIQLRRHEEAALVFEILLDAHPEAPLPWSNYAYLLKTLGRFGEAVAAYRTSTALNAGASEAWWGLANLKLARFFQFDVAEMEGELGRLLPRARVQMHLALAKAYDTLREYEYAARHLATGKVLRLEQHPHDREHVRCGIDEAIRTYAPAFFASRTGAGNPSEAPIFIVGLPRSGSTLIEQILSSHSMIEGTEELFVVQQLEQEILGQHEGSTLDAAIERLDADALRQLGSRYLDLTRFYRRTAKPRFTDKNPANWRYVGLIKAILPNAKIVDARRDPMDCCFANYAQYFNWGVDFSSNQTDVAIQYREYLRLMRHFDHAIPGAVFHLIHEDLIDDLEGVVRRLLGYLGLPYEENCLRFFETERPVHTPSSEQVRQPINRSGIGKWRNYEPWLSELKEGLGETLNDWRS